MVVGSLWCLPRRSRTLGSHSALNACVHPESETYVRRMEPHEIETLRRSLAILPAKSPGLSREEGMRVLAELKRTSERLDEVRDGLLAVLDLFSDPPGRAG